MSSAKKASVVGNEAPLMKFFLCYLNSSSSDYSVHARIGKQIMKSYGECFATTHLQLPLRINLLE